MILDDAVDGSPMRVEYEIVLYAVKPLTYRTPISENSVQPLFCLYTRATEAAH
jgi:hypothetical protein